MTRPVYESSHDRKECPTCNGSGLGRCRTCSGGGCSVCLVSGDPDDYHACETCSGSGWVRLTDAEKERDHGQRNFLEGP